MQDIVFIGLVLLIIGIILIAFGSLSNKDTKDVKVGFGGFVFFIPFGWANDPQMLKWIIVITAIVAIVFIIFMLRGFL